MLLVYAFWCPSHYPTDNAVGRIFFESTMIKDTTNVHQWILVLSTADFKSPVPQFEQFALENCSREWNQTPSVNNITINYTYPATSTYIGNFPKNAQIWTVLVFFILLSIQSLMDLTSCFGQDQEIHWIGDFTFIFSSHNHLNTSRERKVAQYCMKRQHHMGICNIRENLFYVFDNMN